MLLLAACTGDPPQEGATTGGSTGAHGNTWGEPAPSSSDTGPTRPMDHDGSSDDDDGVGFIKPNDGGASSWECDTFLQSCPAGEKCMAWANDGGSTWNATRCVPIARDPRQYLEACTVDGGPTSGVDDCDLGLMCWGVDSRGQGRCVALCSGAADHPICPSPDEVCPVSASAVLAVCLATCHPLPQDCHFAAEGCYPFKDDWLCLPGEWTAPGGHGDPCEFSNACDPGHVCAGAAAFTDCAGPVGCCTTVCDVTDDDADATCAALDPGQSCEAWYVEGMAPPGYENVGVCALPA